MIELNKKKEVKIVKKIKNRLYRRQDAPTVYEMNASIYFWKKKILFNENYLFRRNTGIYLMPFSRSVDIDTEEDLKLVKYFIKNNDKL
jgi:CMP-N,N'-diacetyllegionaminic acid synthase